MANQMATALRNDRANRIEAVIGASPVIQIREGPQPVDCAAADSGTLLVSATLPADWLTAAAGGSVSKVGTWAGTCVAAGIAGHYRIKDSTLTTTYFQGSCEIASGDLSFDDTNLEIGEPVTISAAVITEGTP